MISLRPHSVGTIRCLVLCLTTLCVTPPWAPARAAAPTLEDGAPAVALQRYLLAREHYANGRFAEALDDFQVAWAVFPSSAKLAYNLARTHERLKSWGEASKFYRRYLALSPKAEDRVEIVAVITVLEKRLMRPVAAPASAPASARPSGTGSAPAKSATQTVAVAPPATATRDHRPAWASPAGWSAVGLGVAGLGVGIYGYLAASGAADDASSLPKGQGDKYDQLAGDVDTGNALAVGGLVGGLVFGAVGATLLIWPFGRAEAAVSVVPTPDGAWAQVRLLLP